jgi:hypothetical protein
MKVFNLQCAHGHPFEGWFKDLAAFDQQRESGLLECPCCGSREVQKTLSAPRLNLSGAQEPSMPPAHTQQGLIATQQPVTAATVAPEASAALASALKLVREALANSEDVGARFAQEARAMHSGEAPPRPIHGQTSLETARELAEEGIPVVPLPFAQLLKSPLQ